MTSRPRRSRSALFTAAAASVAAAVILLSAASRSRNVAVAAAAAAAAPPSRPAASSPTFGGRHRRSSAFAAPCAAAAAAHLFRPPPQQRCAARRPSVPLAMAPDAPSPPAAASASSSSFSAASASSSLPPPPIARREEDRVVLAGNVPPPPPPSEEENAGKAKGRAPAAGDDDDDGLPPPRQSSDSPHPLLDPPRSVPDPYGWMRDDDRADPEVLALLKSENAYTEAVTKRLSKLRSRLYDELVGSLRETDHSCPGKDGPHWYYTRTYEGKSYRAHCRAPAASRSGGGNAPKIEWDGSADSPVLPGEKVYLDENELAEGREYCDVRSASDSPGHGLLAYTVDFTGDEKYELRVIDIETGEEVDRHDPVLECDGSVQWGADDSTLFYVTMDERHRPHKVYRRRIGKEGEKEEEDELLYHDPDETTYVSIHKSSDRRYLFVDSSSMETGEVHYLDLRDPNAKLRCVASRRKKVLYEVEHREGNWLITTNVDVNPPSPNMKLMIAPAEEECADKWTSMLDENGDVLFDGRNDRALDDVTAFRGHAVATGREGGVPRVWVISFDEDEAEAAPNKVKAFRRLVFEEDAYDVGLGPNYEYDASEVVLSYDSAVTPPQSLAVPLANCDDADARRVLQSKVIPGYDKSQFGCERTSVPSRDGKARIPVTLVYRKDAMERHVSRGETLPVHLYGYGSYGYPVEAAFRSTRLPLLNRGIVYALAHVRGGGEMGRQWYEEPDGAKYLCKRNTFDDFVDVARWLVHDRELAAPRKLSCEGRSAGGLLVGASVNQDPSLFRVALLGVPFVDVVATMIDASIPLTAGEWEEWGNPNEGRFFEYMLSYSPTNNVRERGIYPSMLLTGGLHDPRVQYWEPTKFAAALRHGMDTERSGIVCVKMEMTAGHFSASDRYKYLRELAFDYAFLLDQMGLVGEEEYDDDDAAEEKGKEKEERKDVE